MHLFIFAIGRNLRENVVIMVYIFTFTSGEENLIDPNGDINRISLEYSIISSHFMLYS